MWLCGSGSSSGVNLPMLSLLATYRQSRASCPKLKGAVLLVLITGQPFGNIKRLQHLLRFITFAQHDWRCTCEKGKANAFILYELLFGLFAWFPLSQIQIRKKEKWLRWGTSYSGLLEPEENRGLPSIITPYGWDDKNAIWGNQVSELTSPSMLQNLDATETRCQSRQDPPLSISHGWQRESIR